MPMLRTSPMETRSSIACHVVSNEIVVSISSTPSSQRALAVVPTPVTVEIKILDQFSESHNEMEHKMFFIHARSKKRQGSYQYA